MRSYGRARVATVTDTRSLCGACSQHLQADSCAEVRPSCPLVATSDPAASCRALCPYLVQSREYRVSRAPQTPLQRVTPISIVAHRCIATATIRHVILIPSPPTPCKWPIVEGAQTQWAGPAAFENPEPLARGQRMQMRRLMRTGTRRIPRITYHLRPGSLPYTPGTRYS